MMRPPSAISVSTATPEALVRGRERTYFEHYWSDFAADRTRSIPEADRKAYTAAYASPGRMRAGWTYFVSFPKTAKDLRGRPHQFYLTATARVRITSGDAGPGPDDDGKHDIIVMDDFIYGEPQASH